MKGILLAVLSSAFIGANFIVKKKGLRRADSSGSIAGSEGYRYLLDPVWWVGMVTMLGGEIANFVAYIFAPAVLVTPLGALSIIVSAVLAHFILKERGCKGWGFWVVCYASLVLLLLCFMHHRRGIQAQWSTYAFLLYAASAVDVSLVLMCFWSAVVVFGAWRC